MVSAAWTEWDTTARRRLDELERVHADTRGTGPGRRWGTGQLNRSLFVALLAQFQTFCRDLHDEAIEVHVRAANPNQAGVLRALLTQGRKLDVQNPRPGALGGDFGRFGLQLIPALHAHDPAMVDSLASLDRLVDLRNAVAHGSESKLAGIVAAGEIATNLRSYRSYRRRVGGLVGNMDEVVGAELAAMLQIPPPW